MPFTRSPDPTPRQIRQRAARIREHWTPAREAEARGVHHLQIKDREGRLLDLQLDNSGRLALPVYVRGIEWVDNRT